jgi:hypothetical protein
MIVQSANNVYLRKSTHYQKLLVCRANILQRMLNPGQALAQAEKCLYNTLR